MAMLTISLLLCAAVALSGTTGAKGAEEGVVAAENRNQCPTGWFQFGSRCFMFDETARTWPLAERHCVSLGANLASVHSSAEYQFLQAVVGCKTGGFSITWIGGFDAVQVEYTHRSVISLVYSLISQGSLVKSDLGLEDLIDVLNNKKRSLQYLLAYYYTNNMGFL
uniref:C-type lectin domain-containing protein n=1 Tax=Hucho hucho TaxID=62062 RepID=A0A4W5PSE3_9TELE